MKTLLAGLLAIVLTACATAGGPAYAQDCISIEQDREWVEEAGSVVYLGVRNWPFTSDSAVFYTADGQTYYSAIVDGCVDPDVHPLGTYRAEANA